MGNIESPGRTGQRLPTHVDVGTLYRRPLFDLGGMGHEELRGIRTPIYDEGSVQRFLHSQFREHAQTYATNYTDNAYFTWLISNALKRIQWTEEAQHGRTILDIGSGAGNSIFPLLQLCPESTVIASDLSVELLALLKHSLVAKGLWDRCALLQLNAEELDFEPESFDLVVGAAILHHLFAPERTILGCGRILKPGGHAIFFEPFENGSAILNLIYQRLMREPGRPALDEKVASFLQLLANDNVVRRGRDKSQPIFAQIDDKWLFTKSFFEEHARLAGFSECEIYPANPPAGQFSRQIEVNLRLGLNRDRTALPPWAWKIIDEYDNAFSIDLMKDLLPEGVIILRK